MEISDFFPFWNKLDRQQQDHILSVAEPLRGSKGTILHDGSMECLGLLLIRSGQLRVYMLSPDGREITLYRLVERDICLFSASCVMPSIQFEVVVEAEKDCEMWVIPSCLFKRLMEESLEVAKYTNELISSRFSDVMWMVEQVMWKSFDKRLAGFLLEESRLEESTLLKITHEKIANHLGSAREVVTRMLRYFQTEGLVKLTRGAVEIVDGNKLAQLCE